ncbi:1597_t:CDS:10 [Scutellospora calospora]|uniref:1597_t:CDS:1 n=1 Tax=Scutellospora calospora TaxID=85575 RepID=A0ACA9KCL0_9GLOM|nr:1597_t:CDS:10 [Scutellospora calospora]
MFEKSPRSSSSSTAGISSRIIGQEDESLELNPSNAVNNTSSIDITSSEHIQNHLHHQSNGDLKNSRIKGRGRTIKMILLTQNIAAVQFTWSVELAYGTPYLLGLGLSKSLMSLVWLAGPLAGLLVQPLVGALSDNSTSRFGRRRPYVVVGSLAVVASFISIGWTKEIVNCFFNKETADIVAMWLAVFSLYVLDFAVNAVMAGCRALIVDSLPPSQQEEGTAWAGKMVGIGSVIGYFMGYINLVHFFPFLGNTQLQVLCVLASIILILSDIFTCWAISEKVYKDGSSTSTSIWNSIIEVSYSIAKSFHSLPKQIQLLCNVQLFAWMGWFPFLFYSTTWVAELYIHSQNSNLPPSVIKDDGERAGSFSLLLFSIVSMTASFILPFLVSSSSISIPLKFAWDQFLRLPLVFLSLPKLWTLSHFIFAFAMLATWYVTIPVQANFIIALCGISWAVAMWAPFSIIGEFASKRSKISDHCLDDSSSPIRRSRSSIHSNNNDNGSDTGTLLGIHNIYIVIPQFIATFFSSVAFALLENPTSSTINDSSHSHSDLNAGADSIGFVLRCGGCMAIVAGFLSMKLWK